MVAHVQQLRKEARRPSSETAEHTTHKKGAQKSAGQNTGTNRIAILEGKPVAVEQPWLTAGTLQEDLRLSSEEVRDDEHLRHIKIIASHKVNYTGVTSDFQGYLCASDALRHKPALNQISNEIIRAFSILTNLANCREHSRIQTT